MGVPPLLTKTRTCYSQIRQCLRGLQLILAFTALCGQAQSQLVNQTKTVQVNLEQYGWQRLPLPESNRSTASVEMRMQVDSKGRTLIGYTAGLGTDHAADGSPKFAFHLLRFTPDGKQDLSISLPTDNSNRDAVFLDASDHIFVVANSTLQMLTGDDQTPAEQRTWKKLMPCGFAPGCEANMSTTRRTLFVSKCVDSSHYCLEPFFTIYDTSSSELHVTATCVSHTWKLGLPPTDLYRYENGYFHGYDRGYYSRRHALCGSDNLQELPLGVSYSLQKYPYGISFSVLNDDLFVTHRHGKRWEMAVVTANGTRKSTLNLAKYEMPAISIEYVKGDAVGDRFAMVVDTWRGSHPALDIGGHLVARRVVVYNSESGTQLARINVYPPIPHFGVFLGIIPGFTYDLSPDGHMLAVLSEGVLTLAKVE
jgi:hypothetical protein